MLNQLMTGPNPLSLLLHPVPRYTIRRIDGKVTACRADRFEIPISLIPRN